MNDLYKDLVEAGGHSEPKTEEDGQSTIEPIPEDLVINTDNLSEKERGKYWLSGLNLIK
jgi:hypothetical protein